MVHSIPPLVRAGTRDLPDVPPFVQYVIGRFLALTRCAAHPLVDLALHYDPAPVVAVCADYYHCHGSGRLPTYTVDQLVRAEIVRTFYDSCSDPDLEWLLAANLLARWFVGLPLLGPTPDHATLNRFHAWLCDHHPDALFRDVLAVLDRLDPEDPATTPQIIDTFAMESPAAPAPSPTVLLGHLIVRLVRQWRAYAPPALHAHLPPLDLQALHKPPRWRTQAQRQHQLQTAVTSAQTLVAALVPHLSALPADAKMRVAALSATIAKVIADETTIDPQGCIDERKPEHKGTYRVQSAVDCEATFRKHEGCVAVFGTNAVISTTPTRIRAALILTGSTPDSEAPAAVIDDLLISGQSLPPALVMDRAGGWGPPRAAVGARSDGQTRLVAYIPPGGGADLTRYTPADFRYDAEQRTCTCPNDVVSTTSTPKPDAEGITFRFTAAQCRGCPLREHCRDLTAKPGSYRTVFISDHHAILREAARFNATEEGKTLLKGPLAGRADDRLVGAVCGLSTSATGGTGRGAMPAVLCGSRAQSVGVACARAARCTRTPVRVRDRAAIQPTRRVGRLVLVRPLHAGVPATDCAPQPPKNRRVCVRTRPEHTRTAPQRRLLPPPSWSLPPRTPYSAKLSRADSSLLKRL